MEMDNNYIIDHLRKLAQVMRPKDVPEKYKAVATFYNNHFYFGWDYSESVPISTPEFVNKVTRQLAIFLITGANIKVENPTVVHQMVSPAEKPVKRVSRNTEPEEPVRKKLQAKPSKRKRSGSEILYGKTKLSFFEYD